MIEEFNIKNFRCFSDITIKPLRRVTLIAGKNDVGKTAVLEAIWLHEGMHNAGFVLNIETFRGIASFNNKNFFDDIFREFISNAKIVLTAKYRGGKTLRLTISQRNNELTMPIAEDREIQQTTNAVSPIIVFKGTNGNGRVVSQSDFYLATREGKLSLSSSNGKSLRPSAIFIPSSVNKENMNKINVERFSAQVEMKRKGEIIEALRVIDNRLQDLVLVKRGAQEVIHGDIGLNRLLPLPLMGEGIERTLSYVLSLLQAENGTVLIDEVENGLHYSIMDKVWNSLAGLAEKYNVQIIATTHSYECIKAAHNSFKMRKIYNFILHRLDRVDDRIESVSYDKKVLEASFDSDIEIR